MIVASSTMSRNWVPHSFFSNKRCMREFGNLLTNDVNGPPRSLFPQAAFRELLGSSSVYGPDETGNLANFSTIELVSLPETLVGCPRSYDVVPESSRHYLDGMQSMIKSKAELENTDPPLPRLETQSSRGTV